ncbi:TraR/DksA C4-type zinc finger protein [Stutzerimonas stutzeri]|uniref:TraR/DksA C4-type zinc finger protein n=1 Tax=Stutzerimonas stutzeri TaxID=316 RepID=UPI00210F06B8|nr:TraR/DksA C4-type zinc finger protein [Stutzerimonas stutzeri]MCQ4257456.1 TraR/DksA C4-type zinc finger protein [Stutzerimonas stutzeri]
MDEHIIEMAERAMAEQLQRSIDNRVQYQGVSLAECEECGDDIPKERQEAVKGCRLCVPCQNLIDLRAKGVRRG